MLFNGQPVIRDTTPNSPGEIFRRLAILAHAAGLIGGPLALGIGLLSDSSRTAATGSVLFGIGLALHLTRARWRDQSRSSQPAQSLGASTRVSAASTVLPQSAAGGPRSRPRLLLLNASLAGPEGNSGRLLARVAMRLTPHAELFGATLSGPGAQTFAALEPALRATDGVIIATGTHWDSWSSPLQKFLEDATPAEVTNLWLGKPAAVLVSEHSTGGKGVLSRLQGVLVTLGCALPPLSGLVIAKSTQIAGRAAPAEAEDFWCTADLDVVADNLLAAARQPRISWRVWPVDRTNYARTWVE